MSLINWIFDIYQHNKIENAHEEARQARRELSQMRQSGGGNVDSARLERALGELALATKTLQRVITEKGICTHSEFADKLRQIDAEDGRIDGQTPI